MLLVYSSNLIKKNFGLTPNQTEPFELYNFLKNGVDIYFGFVWVDLSSAGSIWFASV